MKRKERHAEYTMKINKTSNHDFKRLVFNPYPVETESD